MKFTLNINPWHLIATVKLVHADAFDWMPDILIAPQSKCLDVEVPHLVAELATERSSDQNEIARSVPAAFVQLFRRHCLAFLLFLPAPLFPLSFLL